MRSGERMALAVILGLLLLLGGTTGAAAYAWHRAGTVRIAIHEAGLAGRDISVTLPGVLVNTAIAFCPLPNDAAFNARLHDVAPALRAVASRLSTLPDVVLIDVQNESGTVRVEKSGKVLQIRIVSRDERVDVDVPLESVRQLIQKLDA